MAQTWLPLALVVDDDPDSAKTLTSMLKALGCKALAVNTGQLGEFLEVADCDLAFVCDGLHGPSCGSLAAQIRTAVTPTPRVVLLTSRSVSVNEVVRAGFDDVFPNPMEMELLLRLIPTMLEVDRAKGMEGWTTRSG